MAQAISCSSVRGVFPVHEPFWFCLVQVSTTQFCSFPSFLMARASDGTNVPISPAPASSSNIGSLDGSLPDLEGTGFRASTVEWENHWNLAYSQRSSYRTRLGSKIAPKRLLRQWPPRRQRLQNIEQIVGRLVARVTSLETNAASGSSGPDSARSSNVLGQSNGSTATGSLGSHGPGSSDDNRNTRRRLDTFTSPEDEHARSAVLLRFPCEQYHTGITNWINNFWENQTFQSIINPSELLQSRFCVGQTRIRNKSQMSGLCGPIKRWWFPSWNWQPLLLRQNNYLGSPIQNHLKTGRSESNLRLCGECWPNSSKFSSLMEMTKVHLSSQRSTPAHKVSALRIWRNGVGKPVFKLAPFGSGQLFTLVAPDLCVFLVFFLEVLQRVISQASTANVWWPPIRLPAGRGALFRGFPFRWVLHLALSLTRSMTVHVATPYSREDLLSECSRPRDNLSSLCFTALWLQQNQSRLVQENRPAKDIVLTCFKTFPIKATTCLQVEPMSLHWPVDPIARFDQSCLSLAFPWRSQWRTSRRRSSSSLTCTLEAGCSATTSSTAWYCRSGYMWPLLQRRSAMYYLEQ